MHEKDILDLKVEDVYEILTGKPAMIREDAILKDAVEAISKKKTWAYSFSPMTRSEIFCATRFLKRRN